MKYRNYTFDDYYIELQGIIELQVYNFRNLKTEPEDLKQEAYILLFNNIDRLNEIEYYKSYFKTMLSNLFKAILLDEHKRGLWITGSLTVIIDGVEKDILEFIDAENDIQYDVTDPWIIEYMERKRKRDREYYSRPEVHEHIKKNHKEWIRQYYSKTENKAKKAEYMKEYTSRPEVKERIRTYKKEYYSREDVREKKREYQREYAKKYRAENRDKINERRREQRRKKKQEKLMNNKEEK